MAQGENLPASAEIPGSILVGKDPLEEMATHFSIFAWEVLWTEPSELYSWGHKVRPLSDQATTAVGWISQLKSKVITRFCSTANLHTEGWLFSSFSISHFLA